MWEVLTVHEHVKYITETRVVWFGDRKITINSNRPILPPKERERRKREAEQCLYDVFSRFAKAQ